MAEQHTPDPPQAEPAGRHPGVVYLMRWLRPNPRLGGGQRHIAEILYRAVLDVLPMVSDGPDTTAALRKILEAKDCLVRQSLDDRTGPPA